MLAGAEKFFCSSRECRVTQSRDAGPDVLEMAWWLECLYNTTTQTKGDKEEDRRHANEESDQTAYVTAARERRREGTTERPRLGTKDGLGWRRSRWRDSPGAGARKGRAEQQS